MRTLLLCVLLAGVSVRASAAPLVLNGSFEEGVPPFDVHDIDVLPGSSAITGWSVTNGGVDLLEDPWSVADGVRAVDLDRRAPGGISQTFATVTGWDYIVRFALSGNPEGGSPLKAMRISVAGRTADHVFDTTGQTISALAWDSVLFPFTATDTLTTLTFVSLSPDGSSYGALVDDVEVSAVAVPEPTTLALVATGAVGLWRNRNRNCRRRVERSQEQLGW